MAIKEIAATFVAVCDGCRKEVSRPNKSRPTHWIDLHLLRNAHDFQGCAVADASVKLLLCDECATEVSNAINTSMDARRAALRQAGEV